MSNKSHPQDKEGNSPSFSSFSSSLTSSTVTKGMGLISSYSSPSTSPSPSPEPSDTFPESTKTSTTSSTPALDTHPIQSLSSSIPTSDSSSQSMPLSIANVPSSATPPLIDSAGTSNVSPPSNKLSVQCPISKESSITGLTSLPVLENVTPVNKEEMEQPFVKESPVTEEKSVELQSSTVQKEFFEKRDKSDFIANKETVKPSETSILKPLISIHSQTDTTSSQQLHQLESDTEKGVDSSCSHVGKDASLSVSTIYSKPDGPVITEKSKRTFTPEKMETDETTTNSYRVEDTSDDGNKLTIEPSDSKLLTTNNETMVAQDQESESRTSESLVDERNEDKEIEDVDMSTDVQEQPFEEPMEEEGTTDKLDDKSTKNDPSVTKLQEPDQGNDVQKMVVDEMSVGNALLGSKDEVSHFKKSVLESNEEENRQHEAPFGKEMSFEEPIVAVKSTDNVGEKNTIESMMQEIENEIDLEEKTDREGSSEDKVRDEQEFTMNKNEEHLEDIEALDEPSSTNKRFLNESEATGDKCKSIVVTKYMEKDTEDTRAEEEEKIKKEDEDESIVEKKSDDCLEEDKAKTEEVVVEKMAEDFTPEGEEKVEVTKKDTDDISREDKNTLPQETSEDNVPLVQEEWEKDPVIQQHQDLSQDDNKETDTSQVIEESNKEGREIDSQLKVQEEPSEHEEIIHTKKEDGINQNVSPQSGHLGLTDETRTAASVHAQEFTENMHTSISGVDSEVDGIIQSKLRIKIVQQKSSKHSPNTSNILEEVEIDNEREHALSVEAKEIKATPDLCSKQKENDSTVSMETKNNSNLCSDDQLEHTEEKSIPISMATSTSFRKLQSLDDLDKETQMSKESEKEDENMEINEPLEHDVIEIPTTEPGSHDNKQEVVTKYKQDYVEDKINTVMETGSGIPAPLSTLEDVAMETGSSISPPRSTLEDVAMETGSSIPPPSHNTLEDVAMETGSSISVPLEDVEDILDKEEKSTFGNIPSSAGTRENVEDIIPPPLTPQENVEDINDDQSMESVFSNYPPTAHVRENFEDIRDDDLKDKEETPINKTPQPVGLHENVEDIRDDELMEEEETPISKTPQPQENFEDLRDDELMEEEETPISKTPQPQENIEDIRDSEPKGEEQIPISNIPLTTHVQDNVEDIRDDELKEEETALNTIPHTQENVEDIRDDELKEEEETSISKTPQPIDVQENIEDTRDDELKEEEETSVTETPQSVDVQENVEDIRDEEEGTTISNIPLTAHIQDNVEDIGDDELKEDETSISKTSQPVDVQEKVEDIRDEEEETIISNIPPLAGTQENVPDIRDDELKEEDETSISKTSQLVDVQEKVEDRRDKEEETPISHIPPVAGTQENVEDIRDDELKEEEETPISNIPPLGGTQENVEDRRDKEEESPISKTPQPIDVRDTCIRDDDELKATPENKPKLEEYSDIPAPLTTSENVKNIVDDQPEKEHIPPDQENIEDISDKEKHTNKDTPSPMDAEIVGKKIRDEEDTTMETTITVPSSLLRKNLEDIRNNRKLMEGEVTMETKDHSPVDSRQRVVVDTSKQNIKNNKKPMKGQVTMETEVHSPVQNVVVGKETYTSTQKRVSSSDKQFGSSVIISTRKRTFEDASTSISMLSSSSDNQATASLSSQESLSGDKPISTSGIFGHRPPLMYPYLLSKTLPSTDNISSSSHTLKQSLSETSSVISTPHFSHVTSLVTTSSGPPTFSSSSALTSSPSPLHTFQTIGNVHDKLQQLYPSSTTSSKPTPYTSPVSSKHLSPSAITQHTTTSDKLASLLPPASHVIRSTNTTTDISLGTSSVSTQSSSSVSTSIISSLPSFAPLHPQGITMLPSFSLDSLTSYATTGSGVFPWQPNVISHSVKKPSSKSHSKKIPFTIHGNIPSLPPIMAPSWGLGISRGLQTLPDTHNTVLLPQLPFSSSAIQSGSTCDVSTTTSTLIPPVPSKVMTSDSSLSTMPTSSTVMTSVLPSTMSTPTSEGIRSTSNSNIHVLSTISHSPLSSGFPFTSSSLVTLPQTYKPTISPHKLSQNLTGHLHQIQVLPSKQSSSEVSSTVSSSEHRTTAVEHVSNSLATSLATPLTTSIENTHSFKKTSSLPLSTLSTLLSTSKSRVEPLVQSTDKVTHSIATIRAPIIPSVMQPVVSTFNPRISRSSKSPQPLVTVVPNITTSSSIISTARVFVPPADIGVKQEDAVVGEVEKVTNQQLKLAQQKLAELQHHSYSQLSKPTDVVSNSIMLFLHVN